MVGIECGVAALTLMTDRDDTATVDPSIAVKRRDGDARFVVKEVKFMRIYKRTLWRRDCELDEFIATCPRTTAEKNAACEADVKGL